MILGFVHLYLNPIEVSSIFNTDISNFVFETRTRAKVTTRERVLKSLWTKLCRGWEQKWDILGAYLGFLQKFLQLATLRKISL